MKWSIYNAYIDDSSSPDIVYLYNSLREKYFILDIKLKELLISGKRNINIVAESHPELYYYLLSECFIVPTDLDETAEGVQMIKRKFSSNEYLRITINPTLDCNLKCWYCYESHVKGSCMNPNTIDAISLFISKQVQSTDLKKIQLSFFGGEPLLKYKQVVLPIVTRLSEICRKFGKPFMLSFTTNGVCLTHKIIDELKQLSPEISVQVAFDGSKSLHNRVKSFANGKGCYDIVKNNLTYAISHGIATTIRCNYTVANIDSFRELIHDFKDFWRYENLRFSFHKVWQEPETDELFEKIDSLKQYIRTLGIRSNIDSFYGDSLAPCYADFDNHVVVNYNGDVYKCTARDFKQENRYGYLDITGEIIYVDNASKGIENKFTKDCISCALLPICTICFQQRRESIDGTCPIPSFRKNASINITKYFYDVVAFKANHS